MPPSSDPAIAAQASQAPVTHDAAWRALTREANLAFKAYRDGPARQLYEEALSEAERVLASAASTGDEEAIRLGPSLYKRSCHDIAVLARRQADVHTEGIFIHRAYERLVSVAESDESPPALRASCLRPLSVAWSELLQHLVENGLLQKAAEHSARAESAMLAVLCLQEGSADGQPARSERERTGVRRTDR
jgi:hypothetical protein